MNFRKSLLLGAALALIGPLAWAAEPAADVAAGTWKLNVVKSTFGSESPPKAETRTYTPTPKGMHIVIVTEHADGKKETNEVTLTYDGKTHPLAGNPNYDSASAKRVSANEIQADLIRQGKVVGALRRLVSDDGKTMTINVKTTKPDGTTETGLAVYDRQ